MFARVNTVTADPAMVDRTIQHAQEQIVPALRKQKGDLAQDKAQLAKDRQALPTTVGLADFLRDVQAASDVAGVSVGSMNVGVPSQAVGATTYSVPISLVATGTVDKVGAFLDQIQLVQPRAALVDSADAAPNGVAGSLTGKVDLTLNLEVFVVASASAAASPSPAKSG